jgi:hypothetical protein
MGRRIKRLNLDATLVQPIPLSLLNQGCRGQRVTPAARGRLAVSTLRLPARLAAREVRVTYRALVVQAATAIVARTTLADPVVVVSDACARRTSASILVGSLTG